MPTKITLKQLTELNACGPQITTFKRLFGEEVSVTLKSAVKYAHVFNWNWAAVNLLTRKAWAEYERVTAQAWAEYERVTDPALAEYARVKAPAWAEYERVTAPAWAEYEKAKAIAFASQQGQQ